MTISLGSNLAEASRFGASMGYYSLQAETSGGKKDISNIGVYRIAYLLSMMDHFEFNVGYSIYVIGSRKLDLGFGPDLGMLYFPFSQNASSRLDQGSIDFRSFEHWRPFFGGTFHQRQFQSIQSSYAGPGLQLGADYGFNQTTSIRGLMEYQWLSGPLQASVNSLSLLFGVALDI
jgi:hypothetical protein